MNTPGMNHQHVGPLSQACTLCFRELRQDVLPKAREELRRRRFWAWVLVGFSFALAAVVAFVLVKLGRPNG